MEGHPPHPPPHRRLLENIGDMMGSMGLANPNELRSWHIMRRTSATHVRHYAEIYEFIGEGSLLNEPYPASFDDPCRAASISTFTRIAVPQEDHYAQTV